MRTLESKAERSCAARAPTFRGRIRRSSEDRASTVGLTQTIEPQQTERQAVLDGLSGFALRHCEECCVARASPQYATRITARQCVLEVRRDGQRFQRIIGKLRRHNVQKALANSARERSRALRSNSMRMNSMRSGLLRPNRSTARASRCSEWSVMSRMRRVRLY
jgi:hypothetical protein